MSYTEEENEVIFARSGYQRLDEQSLEEDTVAYHKTKKTIRQFGVKTWLKDMRGKIFILPLVGLLAIGGCELYKSIDRNSDEYIQEYLQVRNDYDEASKLSTQKFVDMQYMQSDYQASAINISESEKTYQESSKSKKLLEDKLNSIQFNQRVYDWEKRTKYANIMELYGALLFFLGGTMGIGFNREGILEGTIKREWDYVNRIRESRLDYDFKNN